MSKRLSFFLCHLFISFLIALVVVGVVFFIWYPSPLATAVGVTHIFLILITIDVIAGPFLGWLVYKEGKKTLKMDLTVIILIQLSALVYGVYTIQQGRPVWLVFNVDQFEVVRSNEIYNKNIKQAEVRFQKTPILSPQFAAVKLSENPEQKQKDMFDEVLNGILLSHRPERYVELSKVRSTIQQQGRGLELLSQYNAPQLVQKTLSKHPQATAFIPLKTDVVDMTVLINKETGEVIKIVDLRPWK
ncbi:TfpX/TfpZ family type IV pilin accessory protein [Acinetobacter haemolyticus]|uniref:TfpX/TfpZ family type IV pilin accessory protein n=1 Tax=Acinetobacter haemolyticus TaxID=29430 RepID=UPI000F750C83|nr:TfpX/TfpZ family type IV pilin accessory protein [Acinetobacter haemolyticus]AZN67958.1 type IV pilin accessory protein [Acinetobacter haemolyticus]MEB6675516.1 type IV pilin accessory protein [Acinetobacter haemolyticus]